VEVAPDLPPIRGNAVQLQQVLLNLMINGMEAMDSTAGRPRALAVGARPLEGGEVEVAVSDSGPGIPAEDVERIFENFYTTKPGGMGMGLSICRDIVAAHGGRVHAENRAGGGAVLRIVLPVERGAR
jgi:signal transduction histidine kinase